MAARARYALSLPERLVRALTATVAGGVHETGQLVLPRFVRRSRLYEVTARNALRIAIELIGGVEGAGTAGDAPGTPGAGRLAMKKAAGNAVELGSIAAFGFSPLWLLAAASDLLNGSRVYLQALEDELAAAGYLPPGTHFDSVDQLLGALQGATGTTASTIDTPPIELSELRTSIAELRENVTSLPTPGELAALFGGLVRMARAENRTLLEVSSGVGLAFFTSARQVSHRHLIAPYREDWQPLRTEGFGAYAARVARPYRRAVTGHFEPGRRTWTERAFEWSRAHLPRTRVRRRP